jgi:hypothetical protein
VVAVAAGVVAHAAADGLGDLREVGDQRVDVEGRERGVVLEEIGGVGDVSLMVLRMMDFHRLGIDVRDESVVSVGEFREFVGHDRDLVFGLELKWGERPKHGTTARMRQLSGVSSC